MNKNTIIFTVFQVIFLALAIHSALAKSQYFLDHLIIITVFTAFFIVHKFLRVIPLHFFLFSIFLLGHALGFFAFYATFPLGIEYDVYLHFFFGVVSSLMLLKFLTHHNKYTLPVLYIGLILVVLGLSALHEIIEYAGAVSLGEGEGLLRIGAGDWDEWDTQKDMLNNLLGAFTGLILSALWNLATKKPKPL